MTCAERIIALACQKNYKITLAESCTGGMIAAALTDCPGSSAAFEYGFVTYSNAAKQKLLGVCPENLAKFGAVSEAVVNGMASGALTAASADIAVAVSGVAGPGGSDFKPEGRVCFAVATHSQCLTSTVEFGALGRGIVRRRATDHALGLVLSTLKDAQIQRAI